MTYTGYITDTVLLSTGTLANFSFRSSLKWNENKPRALFDEISTKSFYLFVLQKLGHHPSRTRANRTLVFSVFVELMANV